MPQKSALHVFDCESAGFRWLVGRRLHDNSVFAYCRNGGSEGTATMVVVCNFTPVPRLRYRFGVPHAGWSGGKSSIPMRKSTAAPTSAMAAGSQPAHGLAWPAVFTRDHRVLPLATVVLRPRGRDAAGMRDSRRAAASTRSPLGRPRLQFRRLRRARRNRSICACSMPAAGSELRRRAARMHRRGLARLSARGSAGTDLWLPCARSLRAGPGAPLQRQQAAARSICARARRCLALERCALWLPHQLAARRPVVDRRDSAFVMPKAVVTAESFDWGDDRPPRTPWSDTVIYETHLRGLTMRHGAIPERVRGTGGGARTRGSIGHLRRLGSHRGGAAAHPSPSCRTALWSSADLNNYWGYNTLAYLAPEPRYLA